MNKEVEKCWFVYGVRLRNGYFGFTGFYHNGEPDSVDFSWKKSMSPSVIGWKHTHPSINSNVLCAASPSKRDNRTMRSWVRGKGVPMICGISCYNHTVWYEYFRRGNMGHIFRSVLSVKSFLCFKLWKRKGSFRQV